VCQREVEVGSKQGAGEVERDSGLSAYTNVL